MACMHREVRSSGDESLRQHIISRTGFDVASLTLSNQRNFAARLAGINWPILKGKALSAYIAFVRRLLPSNLRSLIIDDTSPGEKHKWMYDRESLSALMASIGFENIQFHSATTSGFAPFLSENLDLNPDGSAYKRSSLYAEGVKP